MLWFSPIISIYHKHYTHKFTITCINAAERIISRKLNPQKSLHIHAGTLPAAIAMYLTRGALRRHGL